MTQQTSLSSFRRILSRAREREAKTALIRAHCVKRLAWWRPCLDTSLEKAKLFPCPIPNRHHSKRLSTFRRPMRHAQHRKATCALTVQPLYQIRVPSDQGHAPTRTPAWAAHSKLTRWCSRSRRWIGGGPLLTCRSWTYTCKLKWYLRLWSFRIIHPLTKLLAIILSKSKWRRIHWSLLQLRS